MDPLSRARAHCLALPEATEKLAWGAPTFRIRDKKMFASFADNHHGDGRIALWVHAPEGVQQSVVEAEPEKFFVPPFLGPRGWIGINLDRVTDEELAFFVAQAYCVVAPKKLQAMLDPPAS